MHTTPQKTLINVIGMGRSGTSAITKGLEAVGVNLGSDFLKKNFWNPTGFWEDSATLNINEKLLRQLQISWDFLAEIDITAIDPHTLTILRQEAQTILNNRFAANDYWAFKDPRTVRLLDFWQPIFDESNIRDEYIIAIRNPLSASRSFNITVKDGALLWLLHLLPAIKKTTNKKRVVVQYELLMQEPAKQLQRIQQALSLPFTADPQKIQEYSANFLQTQLVHHHHTLESLKSHPDIPTICTKAFASLVALARDEANFSDPNFIAVWKEVDDYVHSYDFLKQAIEITEHKKWMLKNNMGNRLYQFYRTLHARAKYSFVTRWTVRH